MYVLHEAIARERIRELHRRSREADLARELAACRRWQRIARYARHAEQRHARHAASADRALAR